MYLVEDLIPRTGTTVVYGPPGNAKTLVYLDVARAILTPGTDTSGDEHKAFGTFPIANLGQAPEVLWVCGSTRSRDDARGYLQTIGLDPDHERFHGPVGPIPLVNTDGEQGRKVITKANRKYGPDLVVFDVLNEFTNREPWKYPNLFDWFSNMAGERAVLILHHTNENNEVFGGKAAITGSVQTTYRHKMDDGVETPPGVKRYSRGFVKNDVDRAVPVTDGFGWEIRDGRVQYREIGEPISRERAAENMLYNKVKDADGEYALEKWLAHGPVRAELAWTAIERTKEKDDITYHEGSMEMEYDPQTTVEGATDEITEETVKEAVDEMGE